MKEKFLAVCLAAIFSFALAGCVQNPNGSSPSDPAYEEEISFNVVNDNGAGRYNKPTESQYISTAKTVALYLHMRGINVDFETVLEKLRKNERTDGIGVYLVCQKLCYGKKGVIFAKKNSFRTLPVPVLICIGGIWQIMAYHDELRVLCYDEHGIASVEIAPTTFDNGYYDSDREAVFVTDLGYNLGNVELSDDD